MRLSRLPAAAFLLAMALTTADARAQDLWQWDIEAGGSVFFGEVDQTAFTAGASVEKADSAFELSASLRFDYGETKDQETGASVVSRRSWLTAGSLDWAPRADWSPFVFGTGEQSFEKRIDFRYNGGIGLKHTFVDVEATRIDLSAAVLGEQTFPDGESESSPSSDLLARASFRLRLRLTFGDGRRFVFDNRTFYSPELGQASNLTFRSLNSLDYRLTSVISIGFNFDYDYESLAVDRGARSNDTGKAYLNLKATL